MKNIKLLLLITISLFVFNGCEDDDAAGTKDLNYVTFEDTTFSFGVELDGTTALDIKVFTTQVSSAARSFGVVVDTGMSSADPSSYTVPASVSIPANSNVGLLNVSISDINISESGETLVIGFIGEDGLFTGEKITLNVKQVCPLNELFLEITFDSWPEETTWELLDSGSSLVASGGPYPGESALSKSFCLANGTYTFTIFDSYGDGTNNYKLRYNGNVIVSGGAFGSSETTTFQLGN